MGVSRYIAQRYQRSRRRSRALSRVSVIAIVGITVGVLVLDVTLAVMNGFHAELQRSFVDTMPMITVACHAPEGLSDLEQVIATIGAEPGVVGVSPSIRQEVVISKKRLFGPPISRGAITWGIDPRRVDSVQPFSRQLWPGPEVRDRLRAGAGQTPRLVLGRELALDLYAGLEDTVLVTAPRGEIGLGDLKAETRPFLVAGFLDSGMYEFDSRFVYLDLQDARGFFGYEDRGAGLIGVRVADMMQAAAIADSLVVRLGADYSAVDWMELNSTIFRWVRLEKILMFLLVGLVILVAAFNIIGILTMMVGERGREVGILLAMGASPGQVKRVFMLNGLWLGFWGTAAGSVLGWGLCQYLVRFGIAIPGDVYFVDHLPCIPQTLDFLVVALAAMALTLVSTLVPSHEASRLDPMAIIRYT
ncbi:MAG TPA: ABC transporter permease [Candidatus Krumholzibacteria bacterium]|nr:ABC transporter permease [Candidatus Krumholzibacteria bacterium]HPD71704.1 ABC transporter permease [Candidatus Krumholzibacteria bacterium]HRY41363.1 ABC transporter permease [Candidatus Krumholzibacteria bacterium]